MKSNSQFAVAAHILTFMAWRPDQRLTSECVAASVVTNPVVIRRTLGYLRRAGLVLSQSGPAGGWQLAKRPEEISLRQVYLAVKAELPMGLHHSVPCQQCPIGGSITHQLTEVFGELDDVIQERLATISIANLLTNIFPEECSAK